MTDHPAHTLNNPGLAKVVAALHKLGEATAAAVAERAGLAYSTTTPKLRKLENAGLAEPFRTDDRRTLWRLTPAGHTISANPAALDPAPPATAGGPDLDQSTTPTAEATAGQDRPVNDEPTRQPQVGVTRSEPEQIAANDVHERIRPDPLTTVEEDATEPAKPAAVISTPTRHQPPQPAEAATPPSGDEGADKANAAATNPGDRETRRPGVEDAEATPTDSQEPGAVETAPQPTSSQPQRRPKGALRGAIVDILENHPDRQYKVGELCKLINETQRQSGLPSASAGAVANALDKLIIAGVAVQTVAAPVTVQLAPPTKD